MIKTQVSSGQWLKAHLQGVHEVLNQEEAAHLLQGSVDVGQTGVHVLAESLRGDADILIYQCSAEREKEGEVSTKWGLVSRLKVVPENILNQAVVNSFMEAWTTKEASNKRLLCFP